jgi:hypothetical protein
MELINNLIQHNLIRPGVWLGVHAPQSTRVQQRLRVDRVDANQVLMCVNTSGHLVAVAPEFIHEVDGMSLSRLCAQADLDAQGRKLKPQTRRGRKPKHARS